MPLRPSAASNASVTVVLPAPECGAAIMSPRAIMNFSDRPFHATNTGFPLARECAEVGSSHACLCHSSAEAAAIVGVIERTLAEILLGERTPDEHERGALDP